MLDALNRIRDPNRRVKPVYKLGKDGRHRWVGYDADSGVCVAVGPVRGYDSEEAARDAAESYLNCE